ncbi:peptidylprolyl isomerase [Candidatus Woesearchaeota archaeon]|jgi:FKBP-type peptidyl-prolyl cis-trans isomerase 2|nr:peptidylprolyl isomerase [Candidatus Woesearchaeota archaeon]MBT4835437.1 peptidylprolyl isomerase [Candidatus Woesearchaeota archaeon]MBT6734871.1 peptidylprolyl isomerase [Candidatus Woesearchaeota archaeon]MBT7169614.1 peptidylprolyl isomerase [Candidatus Woesearchaeota archaeon]MBT7474572.1 peptidylprolyl isomerase [Candidatus Woesearchaeota archaeon]
MVKVKKGDFVELEYTGKIKLMNKVFDTSDQKIAKTNDIYNEKMKYGPITICIGEKNVLQGLDSELGDKDIDKEYEIVVSPDNAFGKKDPKKMKIVSMSLFRKQKMNPYPGLQINADGMIGTVRSVSGGRVNLDFNHPLAGRELVYTFKILKKVEDIKEKVNSVMKFGLEMFGPDMFSKTLTEGNLEITSKIKMPEQIQKSFAEKFKKLVPELKKIEFIEEKPK